MSQAETIYYFGFCKRCGTGPLAARVCGGCERLWVICDECDATWPDPKCEGEPIALSDPDLPCPVCNASLIQPPSRWADLADLTRVGWRENVMGQGTPFGVERDQTDETE